MDSGHMLTFAALSSQFLVGLSRSMILFVVCSGMSFVLGVLRVPNVAHGSLYMIGAFLTYTISTLFMAVVFYGLFTGIGLVMRLCRYDPMQRRFEEGASTYWVEHRPAGRASRYFRQY